MQQRIPQLDFVSAVKLAISRVKEMDGRSRRSEFWWTMLALFICNFVLAFIPVIGWILSLVLWVCTIPLMIRRLHDTGSDGKVLVYTYVGIYAASVILMKLQSSLYAKAVGNLDMSAAKLHDALTIPMILLGLAMLIMSIFMLIKFIKDSQPGINQWGPSPKYPNGPAQPQPMGRPQMPPQAPPQMPQTPPTPPQTPPTPPQT